MRSYKAMHKETVRRIALDVIESASDNSAGTIVSKRGIFKLVRDIIDNYTFPFDQNFLDEKIAENESSIGGYLVKSSDFAFGVRNNISLVMELFED